MKPLHRLLIGDRCGGEDLEGHLSIERGIPDPVDDPHAPLPDLLDDLESSDLHRLGLGVEHSLGDPVSHRQGIRIAGGRGRNDRSIEVVLGLNVQPCQGTCMSWA